MIDYSSESSDVIADWIETLAICYEGRPLSLQKIQEISKNILQIEENIISFGFSTLSKRKARFDNSYPFEINQNYAVFIGDLNKSIYANLLLTSPKNVIRKSGDQWHQDNLPKVFEIITEKCLTNFFGESTKTLNFGYPSSLGRPAEFNEAVNWLCQKIGIKTGQSYRPPRKKDGGVDIFVWRNFNDKKSGLPILLVQCTIGEDYINKIGDIDSRLWSSWLSTDIDPIIGIAFPGIVSKDNIWDEISIRGILFDRGRLIEMSTGVDIVLDKEYTSIFNSLIKKFNLDYL